MTMKRLRGFCIVLLLTLPATPAAARPALWVVRDADTSIYLFGTVHLLPKDASWHDPTLDEALAQSQTLYVEVTDDNPANMADLVQRLGTDPAHPLSSQLSPLEAHRLDLLANRAGVPGGMRKLNMMRPWLAALTLTLVPLKQAGLDVKHGVDRQLRTRMIDAGKPVVGLETAEQQIHLLADMPRAAELALLRSTMRDAGKSPAQLTQLIAAWKAGDVDVISRVANRRDACARADAVPTSAGPAQPGLGGQDRRDAAAARHRLHRRRRRASGRTGQRAGAAAQAGHRRFSPIARGRQSHQIQRITASAVSAGVELKQIFAWGARS